jgi:hypothetical protein
VLAAEVLAAEVLRLLRPDLGMVFDGASRHLLTRQDRPSRRERRRTHGARHDNKELI